jgi:RNA polymerase sigma-70 factor (ECF subfamily)
MTSRLSPEAAAQLDELFRAHNDYVLGLAVAQLRDVDRAQDLAQTVWLNLVPQLAKGVAMTNPRSYLAACVRHRAADYWRSRAVRTERPADWSDAVTSRALPADPPADEDALVLGSLSEPQAAVLRLAAQGLSTRAIARRLGRSQSTVWRGLHRGATNLRLAA